MSNISFKEPTLLTPLCEEPPYMKNLAEVIKGIDNFGDIRDTSPTFLDNFDDFDLIYEEIKMGVKCCCRKDCENIMCDIYSSEIGYLCYSCYSELKKTNPQSLEDVKNFVETSVNINKYIDENGKFQLDMIFS
jgi:hypothetical protein